MSIKNRTDLNAQVDVLFPDNSTQFITAAKVREHLTDLDDSAINILGDTSIQGKLGYSTILTISSDGDIPHKKYVDDLDGLVVHKSGIEIITGAKTFSSLATFDTILTGNGSTGSPALKIGGASTGVFRQDSGGAILKWQLNSVQTLWLGENIGTVAKTAFTAESTVTLSALTASTVVYLDGSKNLVSLANASGVLTNDGSGGLSWAAGGSVTSVSGTSNRITSTGGTTPVIDISASYVGQSSITTVGTITTGVWSGTSIAVAKGGTGLTTEAAGSIIAYNTLDTATAITSTSGLKSLQNNAGVISWITTTGTGDNVFAASPTLVTPILGVASATSLAITGTGGAGFQSFVSQSSSPSAPASGYKQFADSSGRFAWIRASDGFVRMFDATLTANRTYTLPDATDTIAVLGTTQTFTAVQRFTGATTEITALTLLDTTYKTVLDVSAANTLRLANGMTTPTITTPATVFNFTGTSASITGTAGGLILASSSGGNTVVLRVVGDANANSGVNLTMNGSATNGSSNRAISTINGTYAPTAGTTAIFRGVNLSPTINETSTAANEMDLLDINPTLTSVKGTIYGIRSRLDANPTGGGVAWNYYGSGTASNALVGRTAFGSTTAPTALVHLAAGTATTSTAPLKFTSGTNLTTAEAGAMEYNGTNLFFTRAGTTRENVLVAVDNASAPSTNVGVGIVNYYGSAATNFLGDPNRWLSVNILGTVYKIPLYT